MGLMRTIAHQEEHLKKWTERTLQPWLLERLDKTLQPWLLDRLDRTLQPWLLEMLDSALRSSCRCR